MERTSNKHYTLSHTQDFITTPTSVNSVAIHNVFRRCILPLHYVLGSSFVFTIACSGDLLYVYQHYLNIHTGGETIYTYAIGKVYNL